MSDGCDLVGQWVWWRVMKVVIDRNACQGYGNCVVAAPDVFDLDDDGKVVLLVAEPGEDLAAAVREAVRDCPVRAIVAEA
jgi:ferredoxin